MRKGMGYWVSQIRGIFKAKFRKNLGRRPFLARNNLVIRYLSRFYLYETIPTDILSLLRCQFHQHFTRAFFVRIFCQSQNVTRKSCRNAICTKNSYVKMLMKLTIGVNFTNILRTALTLVDPKSVKRY